MEMLAEYIKLHRKVIGVYFLFAVIFGIIFALWKLPVVSVLYGTVIGLFVAVIIWGREAA